MTWHHTDDIGWRTTFCVPRLAQQRLAHVDTSVVRRCRPAKDCWSFRRQSFGVTRHWRIFFYVLKFVEICWTSCKTLTFYTLSYTALRFPDGFSMDSMTSMTLWYIVLTCFAATSTRLDTTGSWWMVCPHWSMVTWVTDWKRSSKNSGLSVSHSDNQWYFDN